ncbi:hypothetical protein G3570_00745 [Balneolaceae bacterium YR4-1]|uniref:Uncharacterized protein n=1 Tax=Halalkalibaculum roseum TaxID=2709311 RepID=A0A6M1SQZ6_9BACT|nr:hypothetical protein [Halalkalibaculum roseum]NGP75142.1 hypothetical protein [Halalkalibaculum roseum]
MGVYFIAAGKSSKNRQKSLDQSFYLEQLENFVPKNIYQKLKKHFTKEDPIYIWGANKGSKKQLRKVKPGEYAVDVKNKYVMNVFEFCFCYKTPHQKLQKFIGWDENKVNKRSYPYVYFLKNPQKPKKNNKSYFGKAFDVYQNRNWLIGQRYFNDVELNQALNRTKSSSVEEFLGIKEPIKSNTILDKQSSKDELKSDQKAKNPKLNQSNGQSFWEAFWEWVKAFPGFKNPQH